MKIKVGGFSFDIYFSGKDGIPVVHVDTDELDEDEKGPKCRVYLNDEVLFENPPLEQDKFWKGQDRKRVP